MFNKDLRLFIIVMTSFRDNLFFDRLCVYFLIQRVLPHMNINTSINNVNTSNKLSFQFLDFIIFEAEKIIQSAAYTLGPIGLILGP